MAMGDGVISRGPKAARRQRRFPAPAAGPAEPPSSIADSLLAQAATALALAVALIYAAGGLSLGLKLWFLGVPWTTVLGQLPHDPLIVTAVGQVVVPCLAAGAVLGALIDWLSGMRAGDQTPGRPDRPVSFAWPQRYLDLPGAQFLGLTVLLALAVGLLLGAVPLLVLVFTSHVASGGLQPWPAIWVCCGLLSFAAATGLLYVVRTLHIRSAASPGRRMRPALRRTLLVAAVSVALIPCLCSVSGAFLLPPVYLCRSKFFHPAGDQEVPGYMDGNPHRRQRPVDLRCAVRPVAWADQLQDRHCGPGRRRPAAGHRPGKRLRRRDGLAAAGVLRGE